MALQPFHRVHSHSLVRLLASLLTVSALTGCSILGQGAVDPKGQIPDSEAVTKQSNSKACGQFATPLTPKEQEYAAAAWQYFVNNRQPKTGFTNSAHQFPSGTLWDQGNYLMALNAARWFGLIDQDEFDLQLNQFLTSLGEIPLVVGALPNKVYNSATGEMVDYANKPTKTGLGWSALDIGRLLVAFHIIRTCHPQYDNWISGIVAGWQVPRSIKEKQLYGAVVKTDGSLLPVQ
nr:DUF3131 domain-containing protein [Leptolyngbyaceae cyanobacterium MO_188.B28]